MTARAGTPGKGNCTFVLLVRGHRVGTAFANSANYAVTARHNVFQPSRETVGECAIQLQVSTMDSRQN